MATSGSQLTYSVVGPGAVGLVLAGALAAAGVAVQVVVRSQDRASQLNGEPVTLVRNGRTTVVPIPFVTTAHAAPSDVVIFATKAQDLAAAAAGLGEGFSRALWLSIQNGLGHDETLRAIHGPKRCAYGVTLLPADKLGSHHVSTHGDATTWIGPCEGGEISVVQRVAEDLCDAGISTEAVIDVRPFVWRKAAFNMALNGICGLCDASPALVKNTPDAIEQAYALADEVVAVAQAKGITIQSKQVHDMVDFACNEHRYHKPSMLQDLEAQRHTEIDALNGYLVDAAQAHSIEAPLNRMIAALVRAKQAAPAFWRSQV